MHFSNYCIYTLNPTFQNSMRTTPQQLIGIPSDHDLLYAPSQSPTGESWSEPHLAYVETVTYKCKRVIDLTISLLVIVFVLSWLLPILCLLIYLEGNGSPLFIQDRVGKDHKLFKCIKLRTMKPGDESPEHRITRLGKLLRHLKLDEFPQFINVLKGEMSIVGPRPHPLHEEHFTFSSMVGPSYFQRHAVVPGITGLAQIQGYQGPVKDMHAIKGRVKLDLFYIENWNLHLELHIVWQTFLIITKGVFNKIFSDKNAGKKVLPESPKSSVR